MSDAIMLDVADATPVRLDVGDADPIAREEIAALAGRVTTVEGDVTALDGRMDAAEGEISTLGTTVDGIDARVEAIEADYVTSEDMDGLMSGHNPSLSAGSATGITGDVETASWMARQTNADGAALIESVKGNTLRWNQLLSTVDGTSTAAQGVTRVVDNGIVTLNGTSPAAESSKYVNIAGTLMTFTNGHKYLINIHNERLHYYANVTGGYSAATYPRIFTAGADQLSGQLILIIPAAETVFENEVYIPQVFDLTTMFGAGNEPSTVAEFEALYPLPYYPYDPGSLLPVRMEGIETTGFNQWDEQWELGSYNNTNGEKTADTKRIRCKNLIPVFPDTDYYLNFGSYSIGSQGLYICFYDANGDFLSFLRKWSASLTTPTDAYYMTWRTEPTYGTTYNHDICINLSDTSRNGEYEPYWSAQRAIPASTYFPDGMRSAGSVYDELTETQAITRVGAVDLGTLDWSYSSSSQHIFRADISDIGYLPAKNNDTLANAVMAIYQQATYAAISADTDKRFSLSPASVRRLTVIDSAYSDKDTFKAAMSGVLLFYALATPTTTPVTQPMAYRVGRGGIERVMVAEGTMSAPPIFATRYPLDPADLAASIAPVDGPTAKTNHQVGDLIMLGFTLCKATQVIVTGETIAIGTNVTRTTVAAELAALSE